GRSLSARHLLHHRPLPLHRRSWHNFWTVCGGLLLVPESNRSKDERVLGQGALLAVTHLHECDLHAAVPAGHARHASPLVRWWPGLGGGRRPCLGSNRVSMEYADLVG